jgi:cytochrome c oxidase subunit 3
LHPERNYLIHPSSVILILLLGGLSAAFLALSAAFVYVRAVKGSDGAGVPLLFYLNTIVLLVASATMKRWTAAFRRRDEAGTLRWGWLTLGITLVFLAGQVVAWRMLFAHDAMPATSPGYGYLYALSILHLLHVAAGLPFLLHALVPLARAAAEGSMALLFLDDKRERRVRHLAWYWHFLDAVWLYVVIFLGINSVL